jgi:hypothetical protein
MSTWNYEIVHDYNGSQLIKEFRAENKLIKDSKGTNDEALDFIIYAEKCDGSISLGAVLLIKMSDVMVKYYYNYRGEVNLTHFWAKHISKQQKYNHTFHFTESQIAKAFIDSLALQTKLVGDVSVVYIANYVKQLKDNATSLLLENLKFTREQYDPTLDSENYLFYKSKKAADYFVSKCNDTTHALQQFKDKISLFKSFKIAGLELNTPIISDIIFVIDNLLNKVASFRHWILKNQEAIQLKIAYLCGIWNGMVEFVSAIVDVVLLAVNVLVDELLENSINLELLEIREGIEEVLVKLNKPPDKLVEQLLQAIERYKYTRYEDKSLTIYQKEYHRGEDEILAIDIITSIILIIRSVPSLAKNLSKFSKWLDEILERWVKRQSKSELSDDILRKLPNKEILQKTSDIEQLYADAVVANKELKTKTNDFAKKNEGTPAMRPENINNGLKSKERTIEKVISEYAGDASKILDIAGSKVIFERVDHLYDALNNFQKSFKILKFKDRIQNPLPTGYRDIIVNIEMSNRHIVEFKLVLKEMDDIAEGIGHKLYEEYRSLEAIGKTRKLTVEEKIKMQKLLEEQVTLYNNAWEQIILKK